MAIVMEGVRRRQKRTIGHGRRDDYEKVGIRDW